jgi:hypothetical protein
MPSIALAAGRDRFRGADQNRGTSGCPRVGRAACYYFCLWDELSGGRARPIGGLSKSPGVAVMVTKQLSIAIAIIICMGSGIAFKTFAAVPASATRIDFDRVFADATQQSQFPYVDRARKSDRLPSFKAVLLEPALLPNCEPLVSPFADPILGKIVGRCDA